MDFSPPAEAATLRMPPAPSSWRQRWPYVRIGIVALAAILRLWQLDLRPPHFDEGVNGWFLDQMQKIHYYKYDPSNYHGPLHFYVLFVFKCLLGRNLWALRLPVVIIGTLTVDWLWRFERFFGRAAAGWAALAMAVSPGFLYYQRDAIHETWLAFFLVLAMWGLLGLWQEGRRPYLWAVGMGLTGMILTKETYVIHVGCLILALPCAAAAEQALPSLRTLLTFRPPPEPLGGREGRPPPLPGLSTTSVAFDVHCAPQCWRASDLALVAGVGVALVLLFYSGTGYHWAGVKGLITAYAPWGKKANEGEGHNKPFLYWLQLIWHNEPFVFFGLLASLRYALLPSAPDWRARLVAFYALGNMLAYSIIPYKTPWCVLSWAWPFFLTGGLALAELPDFLRRRPPRWAFPSLLATGGLFVLLACLVRFGHGELAESSKQYLPAPMLAAVAGVLLTGAVLAVVTGRSTADWLGAFLPWPIGLALLGISAAMAVSLNYRHPEDEKEAYVYVQTFYDVNEIVQPLYDLAKENPVNYHLRGLILCDSTYPLPWLLGDFTSIGYYSHDNKPPDYHADFLLVTKARVAEVEKGLDDIYFKQTLRLRSALEPQTLYLRASLFQHLMPERKPEFHPLPPGAVPTPDPDEPIITPAAPPVETEAD